MHHDTTAEHLLSIRPATAQDNITALTQLLHRAYQRLGNMGLRYMAVDQTEAVTQERMAQGTCLLAFYQGSLCGTILLRNAQQTNGCPWYNQPQVASIGQFAVDPDLQAQGIGWRLMQAAEQLARESGAKELALDTAEQAEHLVGWYQRLGYRFIETVQWGHTNYRSVILSLELHQETPEVLST